MKKFSDWQAPKGEDRGKVALIPERIVIFLTSKKTAGA